MEKLWTDIFHILIIAEYVTFYYVLFRRSLRAMSMKKAFGLLGICTVLWLETWLEWNMDVQEVTVLVAAIFAVYLIFDISFGENMKLWIVTFTVLSILESVIDYMAIFFFGLNEMNRKVIYTVCIIIGLWICYAVAGRKWDKDTFRMPVRVWFMIVVMMMIFSGMITYFLFALTKIPHGKNENIGIGFIATGGIAICILLFAMIYYFNVTQKYQMQTELLEALNEQQREYFMQLLQREQDTRQFRHDIIDELLELKNYCEKEDYESLYTYLTGMLGSISEISSRQYDVGNDIVNTIINYYFQPLQSECSIMVKGYMQDEINISQRDICIIVSNLVKNAVEAVRASGQSPKEILFSVNQGSRYLNIQVENTMEGNRKMLKNGLPDTAKEDKRNHGLGLKNVMSVVEKYEGTYHNRIENQRYFVEIVLKM